MSTIQPVRQTSSDGERNRHGSIDGGPQYASYHPPGFPSPILSPILPSGEPTIPAPSSFPRPFAKIYDKQSGKLQSFDNDLGPIKPERIGPRTVEEVIAGLPDKYSAYSRTPSPHDANSRRSPSAEPPAHFRDPYTFVDAERQERYMRSRPSPDHHLPTHTPRSPRLSVSRTPDSIQELQATSPYLHSADEDALDRDPDQSRLPIEEDLNLPSSLLSPLSPRDVAGGHVTRSPAAIIGSRRSRTPESRPAKRHRGTDYIAPESEEEEDEPHSSSPTNTAHLIPRIESLSTSPGHSRASSDDRRPPSNSWSSLSGPSRLPPIIDPESPRRSPASTSTRLPGIPRLIQPPSNRGSSTSRAYPPLREHENRSRYSPMHDRRATSPPATLHNKGWKDQERTSVVKVRGLDPLSDQHGESDEIMDDDDSDDALEVDPKAESRPPNVLPPVSTNGRKKQAAGQRFACPEPGCKETFTRKNDVTRHRKNAAVHRGSALQGDGDDKRCKRCNCDLSRADARARHERAGACGKRTLQKKEYISTPVTLD